MLCMIRINWLLVLPTINFRVDKMDLFFIMLALTVGMLAGGILRSRQWREKGDKGFPRMLSAGKLYWVNRDDKPCWRCSGFNHEREKRKADA